MGSSRSDSIRGDLKLIAEMIEPATRVLDVGCGDGALLDYLYQVKQVDGRGIEISSTGVNACVSAGLSVIQGDADTDLADYPDGAFDYTILSQTLQATHAPHDVLGHLTRIGKRAIVSIPNFAHWRARLYLLARGRMPVSKTQSYQWFDTPNIHLCTIRDFVTLCRHTGVTIERGVALDHSGRVRPIGPSAGFANLFGEQAIFLLRGQ